MTHSDIDKVAACWEMLGTSKARIAWPFRDRIYEIAQRHFQRQNRDYVWTDISLLAKQSYYVTAAERYFQS